MRTTFDKYFGPVAHLCEELIGYLEEALKKDMLPVWEGLFTSGGKLSLRAAMRDEAQEEIRGYGNNKVWLRKRLPTRRSHKFTLLLDESNSMASHNKDINALRGLTLLIRVLEYFQIDFNIIGFSEGRPTEADIHKDFGKVIEPGEEDAFIEEIESSMNGRATYDVDGLDFAIEQMREQEGESRVIIVLTDGEGNAENKAAVRDEETGVISNPALTEQLDRAALLGMDVIGIGIGEGIEYVEQLYEHSIQTQHIEDVPLAIARIII